MLRLKDTRERHDVFPFDLENEAVSRDNANVVIAVGTTN